MEKEKSHFRVTLKLEVVKKTLSLQGQKRVLLMYFIPHYENEIIHILVYFIETRQLGMEQESAKYGNAACNQERTNFKQDPLQHFNDA